MQLPRRSRLQPTIPMVSMADVAFLLITFFLITTTFSRDAALNLKLPGAKTAQAMVQRDVNIKVTRDRKVYLDDIEVSFAQLPVVLRQKLMETGVRAVTIRGDHQVAYGIMVGVMDIVNELGVRINLAAEKVEERDLERLGR